MPKARLAQLLEEIHEELSRTDEVDDASRRLLTDVMDDIRGVLDRDDTRVANETLVQRLASAAEQFEGEHPALARSIAQVATTLERLGL